MPHPLHGVINVTRQGFYWYLTHRDSPWKYEGIAEKIRGIVAEEECNDTYGRCRMYQALKLKYPEEDIPSERTVYRIMEEIGLGHRQTEPQAKRHYESGQGRPEIGRSFQA